MSFVLNQVTQRAGGGNIVRTKIIANPEPVIGRGADCDIQIPDLAVSLRHAVMRKVNRGRIEVRSLGQLQFEADGVFTRSAQLSLAERPTLMFGSHELNLALGSAPDEVIITLSRSDSARAEPLAQDEKTVFRLASSMFSRRSAAWALGAALLALCLIAPIVVYGVYRNAPVEVAAPSLKRADVQWESGKLSPGHRFLEGKCQACHQKPFVAVRDDACLACHKAGLARRSAIALARRLRDAGSVVAPDPARDHAALDRLAKAQPELYGTGARIHAAISRMFNHPDGRCESCHTEHVGPAAARNLRTVASNQVVGMDCTGCHAGLKARLPDTKLLDVGSWERHPNFRPVITRSPDMMPMERVALADHPTENNGLTFPHALHLSATGGVARMARELGRAKGYGAPLDCASCHRSESGDSGYRPVEMMRDCSACHSLAYTRVDSELKMLKHGDSKDVVKTLKAFYSTNGSPLDSMAQFRRPPGSDTLESNSSMGSIVRRVKTAFYVSCHDCHTIMAPRGSDPLDFNVIKPHITTRYLPRGGFDHSVPAHRADANGRSICSSCHKAESSKSSSDVLLPQIARCAACHGQPAHATPTAASADCKECHGYHQPGTPALNVSFVWPDTEPPAR